MPGDPDHADERRVVLAMSGGVDSSVAACILKDRGYDVLGLFMKTGAHWEDQARRAKTCCSAVDADDARRVADKLDIPFYALDFESEFSRVVDDFTGEYLRGRTPNPCVMCNLWFKFGKLWAYGKSVGAARVATGHYARVLPGPDGTPRLARGVDRSKDQTYVLSALRPDILRRVLLPVGDFTKDQIRAIARQRGLAVHDKPDSQEICFIPDNDHVRFMRERHPELDTAGEILDHTGAVVGRHRGYDTFTIGQRRGLGLAFGEPRYVVAIDPPTRRVSIGPRAALDKPGLLADRFNWQDPQPPAVDDPPRPCRAQIRAQHRAVPATVRALPENRVLVRFETPQPAVTPGQVVTLYDPDDLLVLGGGWIESALEPETPDAGNPAPEHLPNTSPDNTRAQPAVES